MSPRNVTLADLALNIKAYTTVNLLDSKHYSYTLEQLLKSKESGSLFHKRGMVSVRDVPPERFKSTIPIQRDAVIPSRQRSVLELEEKEYEELKISEDDRKKQDEIYARENADLADIDVSRSIPNKKV
jgi:hypothetical protein